MRRVFRPAAALLLLLIAACTPATEPERRSLIGSWSSTEFGTTTVRMTLTETAREVRGAGSWIEPNRALAFHVEGAHAERAVALILLFPQAEAVSFRGAFTDAATLVGTLTGGRFREEPITFVRDVP
jgi:hypothetical protein